MLIDTHSHLDVLASHESFDDWMREARARAVQCGLITTGSVKGFGSARQVAYEQKWAYALGIHPMFVAQANDTDLEVLEQTIKEQHHDNRLVAVGEIGLDFYIDEPDRVRQERFFTAQMAQANQYALPVSLHARRALYRVIAIIKDFPSVRGVIHAFPGSKEEARQVLDLGYKIGVGGAVTYPGSKRLRDLVRYVPKDALVLETDCPDMAPVGRENRQSYPFDIADYLTVIAQLRDEPLELLESQIFSNTLAVFPRLASLV